jgi:hypothetical protein
MRASVPIRVTAVVLPIVGVVGIIGCPLHSC